MGAGLERWRGVYGTYLCAGSGVNGCANGSCWFSFPIDDERGGNESRLDIEVTGERGPAIESGRHASFDLDHHHPSSLDPRVARHWFEYLKRRRSSSRSLF